MQRKGQHLACQVRDPTGCLGYGKARRGHQTKLDPARPPQCLKSTISESWLQGKERALGRPDVSARRVASEANMERPKTWAAKGRTIGGVLP